MGTYYPSHNYGPEHAASLRDGTYADFSNKPKRPISEKQLEANRRNALRSTGPTTAEGKARSSHNAFRHGLTSQVSVKTEEDRLAHANFTKPLIEALKPEGAVEEQLAISIAEAHWRLNRARAMEDNMFALGHYGPASNIDVDAPELHTALTSAQVFLDSSKAFERLTLYENRIHRTLEKDMAQLEALQSKRKADREAALEQAAQITEAAQQHHEPVGPGLNSNGFEFSTEEIAVRIHCNRRLRQFQSLQQLPRNPKPKLPKAA